MKNLPEDFIHEMKSLLDSDEYDEYINNIDSEYYRGIRINRIKCSVKNAQKLLPFELKSVPFCETGFYIPFDVDGLGASALHRAGAFYSQEPSAMSAVTVLDVHKGDYVLDLCAAPGGKSTQIADMLGGTGLLWSNEIVKNRANILLSNIERMGISNSVVSSCHPEKLCESLFGYFDRILVDAPCSGEGMFRKDGRAVDEWTAEHSKACADRQLSILESAANALKEGGTLVYSTCTFSVCENEGVIEKFLTRHPEFSLVDCGVNFGRRSAILPETVRIFPRDGGEGHFAAKLQRRGELLDNRSSQFYMIPSKDIVMAQQLYSELFVDKPLGERFEVIGDKILLLPDADIPALHGLGVIRAGVLFAEKKKNRVEPCHAAFMAVNAEQVQKVIDMKIDDIRINKYYKGEEIEIPEYINGFTAVAVEGMNIGFGKASGGVLKNRLPKGLRC
ncbi:MAG: RsmF rRNA methyltransferase first C-terminal domain-containing protein [Clostridia bacterium]|nr:RsmF rRNA methyltransferase first C-terminal domain-containing protein [Clostridia bacterium]